MAARFGRGGDPGHRPRCGRCAARRNVVARASARRRARRPAGLPRRLSRGGGDAVGARPARSLRAARATTRLRAAGHGGARRVPHRARVRRSGAERLDRRRWDHARGLAAGADSRARGSPPRAPQRRAGERDPRADVGQPGPAPARRRAVGAHRRGALADRLERDRRSAAGLARRAGPWVLVAAVVRVGRRDPRPGARVHGRHRRARAAAGAARRPERDGGTGGHRGARRRPRQLAARRCRMGSCTGAGSFARSGATARPESSPRWPRSRARTSSTRCCSRAAS